MTIQIDPKQQITVRLPLTMIRELNAMAEREDRLVAYMIRKAIQEMFDRYAEREGKGRAA